MAWVPIAIAAVGALSSMKSGKDAADAAGQATAAQTAAMNAQLDFNKQVYQDQKNTYGPLANKLVSESMQPGSLDWNVNKGAIESNYANAEKDMAQKMSDQGMDPNSGVGAAMTSGMDIRKAQDLSKQWATGVMNKRQLASALLGHDMSMQGANNVSNAYGNNAGMYGQQTGMYLGMANQSSQAAGQAIQNGMYNWQYGKANGLYD